MPKVCTAIVRYTPNKFHHSLSGNRNIKCKLLEHKFASPFTMFTRLEFVGMEGDSGGLLNRLRKLSYFAVSVQTN